MLHDIFTAVLAWIVPIVGVYLISLIPKVRKTIVENPVASAVIISWLLTAATFVGYDQFVLLGAKRPDAHFACPPGQVVVGVNTKQTDGGPAGIVAAIGVVCQPISLLH